MPYEKRKAPAVLAHRTGANEKYRRTYDSTEFRRRQEARRKRRELWQDILGGLAVLALCAAAAVLMPLMLGVG